MCLCRCQAFSVISSFFLFLHLQCIRKQSSDLILNRLYHHFLKSRSKKYWHTDEMTLYSTKLWFEWKVYSDDCNILKVSVGKKIIKRRCRGWYVFVWTSPDRCVSDCAHEKGPWQWLMLDSMASFFLQLTIYSKYSFKHFCFLKFFWLDKLCAGLGLRWKGRTHHMQFSNLLYFCNKVHFDFFGIMSVTSVLQWFEGRAM